MILYIVIGSAYKIKIQDMKGVDALPNIEFWREFPFLVQVVIYKIGWTSIQY